ncbi:MAG: lipopolysaccharide kinase InaA family protein [Desulfuromonas sp.]|nr:lipopolysaccharide kinase InaA family protein [Desulfuromonas sp.]
MIKTVKVSSAEYADLLSSSSILEQDGHGVKVLYNVSGQIIKIFRRKRLLSGALFFPYAQRFAANAQRLHRLRIPTIEVIKLGRCNDPKRDLVWYQPLAGVSLREYCRTQGVKRIVDVLAQFIAELHHKGVLFRSVHWGNIIVTDESSVGLIDIADIRFYCRSLTLKQRQRNFRHMLRYSEDQKFFQDVADEFWSSYTAAAHLTAAQIESLQRFVADQQ